MLKLPLRGDVVARRMWLTGIALYLILAGVFLAALLSASTSSSGAAMLEMLGLGERKNFALTLLVVLGVLLAAFATALVHVDIVKMRVEEEDIEWVRRTKRRGVRLVLAPADKRERMLKEHKFDPEASDGRSVESLLDDRVRRCIQSQGSNSPGAVIPEELRLIAEKRTSAFGGAARYASSLLLLFAVLGTFAGVKTALPGLIAAVSNSTTDYSAIRIPLQAVADAFGGNALALIGAIAVGLMAQGVSFGRRNLLERLELVSAEYVYHDEGVASGNPLVAAAESLNKAVASIKHTSGALVGIQDGLTNLSSDFERSFKALEQHLTDLATRHESDLYDKTAQTLFQLQTRVGELTEAVHGNAAIYRGLVDRIDDRAAESRNAIEQLRQSNRTLSDALTGVATASNEAGATFAKVGTATDSLTAAASQVSVNTEALATAAKEIVPALRGTEQAMSNALAKMAEVERRAAESWQDAGLSVKGALGEVTKVAARTAVDRPHTDTQAIVDAITRVTAGGGSSPLSSFLLPLLGAITGGGVVYLVLTRLH